MGAGLPAIEHRHPVPRIAGKPGSHRFAVILKVATPPVGAGLPAIEHRHPVALIAGKPGSYRFAVC